MVFEWAVTGDGGGLTGDNAVRRSCRRSSKQSATTLVVYPLYRQVRCRALRGAASGAAQGAAVGAAMPEASVSGVEVEVDTDKRIAALADLKVPDITSIYEFGDELGRGRFSVVQAATHKKEGVKYAVKVVENETLGDEENLEALETEIKILRQLSNPHIVQLKEVVTAKENTYIVMELLSGGEARGCASNP